MPRGSRTPSKVFKSILADANAELVVSGKKSGSAFTHRGILGDERALALHRFLGEKIPASFGITKGEVIDFGDRKSGQLDLIIYDRVSAAPLEKGGENMLLPCESLYVVIEIKSVLNGDEIGKAIDSAKKLRALRPFKKRFVPARQNGEEAIADTYRCLYVLFAFKTNLGKKDWLEKEFRRFKRKADEKAAAIDLIDRIVVLDRGMIAPVTSAGKVLKDKQSTIFLEFFLHIVNFIRRETRRRPTLDLQMYSERTAKGWKKIK